ncbi:MAG: Sir2 family NAD-dependent protein deacetylase [Bacteroidota bacterium]
MDTELNLKLAAEALNSAGAILITAGAGIGVDSGLPDFRGNQGFWKAYPPIAKLGISFSEMANPMWFAQKPELAWAFYGHRLNLYRSTKPHDGYGELLKIGKKLPGGYFVFTSNVDGQFQKAGYDDDRIEECHGSIHHFQCMDPCSYDIWDAYDELIEVDMSCFEALEPLPCCPNCGKLARPNILMFGDWNWLSSRTDEQAGRLQEWLNDNYNSGNNLVIVELGAGTAVATVRYTSERIAARYEGTLIRINPRDYNVPAGHISVPYGSVEGIDKIKKYM